jgi:hypothetical protein
MAGVIRIPIDGEYPFSDTWRSGFLHRYYDILRDTDRNLVVIEAHDVSEDMRQMFLADDPDTHPELVEQEVNRGLRLVRGQEG